MLNLSCFVRPQGERGENVGSIFGLKGDQGPKGEEGLRVSYLLLNREIQSLILFNLQGFSSRPSKMTSGFGSKFGGIDVLRKAQ